MTYKDFIIAAALSTYIAVPIYFIIQKYTKENQLAVTLTHEADLHGNRNGQLDLAEINNAYERMGINPQAITINPYQRLVASGDPTAKNKPFDFRYPTISDLENAIQSYRQPL